jgi:hypothetical protein
VRMSGFHLNGLLVAAAMLVGGAAAAQDAPRLNDNDLKRLIEDVDHGRDRFEDALDGDFKHSIVRGPRGEVSVNQYLDDLQENVKRLKERYTSSYSASNEALTVLRQGTDIDRYMKSKPDSMKGASEWDRLAGQLSTLAAAYGTSFPLPENGAARRINDNEAASAADLAAKQADDVKKAIDRDEAIPKPQRDTLKKEADDLAKTCKVVESRVGDGKPATAEARQMFDAVDRVSQSAASAGASPTTMAAFGPLRANMEKLYQAFGVIPMPK